MQNNLSFNKFAATLATLGATSLTAGAALASPVTATEADAATALSDKKEEKKVKTYLMKNLLKKKKLFQK